MDSIKIWSDIWALNNSDGVLKRVYCVTWDTPVCYLLWKCVLETDWHLQTGETASRWVHTWALLSISWQEPNWSSIAERIWRASNSSWRRLMSVCRVNYKHENYSKTRFFSWTTITKFNSPVESSEQKISLLHLWLDQTSSCLLSP